MKNFPFVPAMLGLSLVACGQPSPPMFSQKPVELASRQSVAPALKSGEQVYRDVCFACHEAGVANAPKSGDQESWRKLIEEGQAVVTAHGWVGVRGMPAKGGRPDLSMDEFARAVAWMARSAGADWQDPDAAMMKEIREEEEARIEDLAEKAKRT